MLSSKFSSLLRFFVFSLRRFARMTWSLTLYYEPLSTSPTLHEFPLSLARSPLSRIPRIRQENFSLISSSPFPPSLLSPPLTYSASSRMINNASSRHQSELLSSAKEVVAASRQLKLPLQSFMSWDWNVSLTLNKGEAAPSWLARKTDFNLLKSWLAELLKALKDGKVSPDITSTVEEIRA